MLGQQNKGLTRLKGHSRTQSTDTLCSQRKRQFLSVVSAGSNHERPPQPSIKTVAQLKRQAMGHRTTRSNSEQLPETFTSVDLNKVPYRLNIKEVKEPQANTIKIMSKLTHTTDWSSQLNRGLETPIKKLLFESNCKENWL
jgi:hypothetical protein